MGELKLFENTSTHVVDILGNVRGRDQPIMLMSKALELIETLGNRTLSQDVVFFDPFCKGGEVLLACAMARNRAASSDRKSTRLNSSHVRISYAVFCLKKKKTKTYITNDV